MKMRIFVHSSSPSHKASYNSRPHLRCQLIDAALLFLSRRLY
jgi:hypothetical protein